ncbi:hypothetical protein [Vibrio mediterranei]|uniref:hypothetical protein n=1 Tax=Vibrio mediterranei TaxID=689 RepID=UPI001EFCDB90|nr:hypothetical protein [Vibrio mediterranei]MCG9660441.1 hypothetical protein [Vibrio mediterranei]
MRSKNLKVQGHGAIQEALLFYLLSPEMLLWLAKRSELRRRHLYCAFSTREFPMQVWQKLKHLEVLSISFSDGHTWYP